jgi:hypothetical protein
MTILDHLRSRYFDTNLHRVWVDENGRVAVFPIWNLSGQLIGYQQYKPDANKVISNNPHKSRYFTRLKDKKIGVWGLESWNLSNTLFVTEGIFDACRITNHGHSAICVFGNSVSSSTMRWFETVRKFRPVVAVCDDDDSGRKLARLGLLSVTVEGYKDLGDASEDYVKELCKKYSKLY